MSRSVTKNIRLLITGGGTGGHLFPAVAAAQEFKQQMPDTEVLFVGTRRKVDTGTLAAYGFQSKSISSYGLKGKRVLELIKAIAVLPWSCLQSLLIMRKFKPNIVLGVGGYVTGPVMVTAKLMGLPTVIHEQNSVPGLANRKLGKLVDRVCLSLPESGGPFPFNKIVYTGNPVRNSILELANSTASKQQAKSKTILVLGGSQGAQAVNRLVTGALSTLPKEQLSTIKVIHQTGEKDLDTVKESYQGIDVESDVQSFITEMQKVYARADLIISRSGATTLSEIAVLGKPAILIPFPFAADNHQERNGEYYVAGGGALQYREKELSELKLAGIISSMLADEEKMRDMGNAMKDLAFPKAAEKIVACCLDTMESEKH